MPLAFEELPGGTEVGVPVVGLRTGPLRLRPAANLQTAVPLESPATLTPVPAVPVPAAVPASVVVSAASVPASARGAAATPASAGTAAPPASAGTAPAPAPAAAAPAAVAPASSAGLRLLRPWLLSRPVRCLVPLAVLLRPGRCPTSSVTVSSLP